MGPSTAGRKGVFDWNCGLKPQLFSTAADKLYGMEYKENNHSAAKAMTRARASTENILGIRSREPKINPKWARHYEHLTRLREEIVAKKASLAQDANANAESPLFGEHLADAAT